ncbi:MAG: hypothetical protein ABR524_05275 [Thermoanaerobaculia bacterium]
MRPFVLALLLVLTSAPALQAQIDANCLRVARWGERGQTQALQAEGSKFWAADGRGVTVFETGGGAVRAISSIRTASPSTDIELLSGSLIILTRGHLELWSRSAESPLGRIDSKPTEGTLLAADGSTAVTASGWVEIFDVTPVNLVSRWKFLLPRPATAIDLAGDILFVTIAGFGTFEYQIAGGTAQLLQSHPADAVDVAIGNDAVYFAALERGLLVLDRATGIVSSFLDDRTHWIDQLALDGNQLALSDHDRIVSLDVSDFRAPRVEASVTQPVVALASSGGAICSAWTITDAQGFVSETPGDLRCWSRSGEKLVMFGELAGGFAGPLGGVALSGRYAFVADPPMLRVLDLANPARPIEVAAVDYGRADDRIRHRGNQAIVYGRANVHLFDVTNPANPVYRGAHESGGIAPSGADFAGSLIAEANRGSGLHIMSPDPASWPAQIGGRRHPSYGQMHAVVGYEGWIYALVPQGVLVMDISNLGDPGLGNFYPMANPVDGLILEASGGAPRLLVISQNEMLRIFDLSILAAPLEIGAIEVGLKSLLSATGRILWASSPDGRVDRVDLTNPANPQISHTITGFLEPAQASAAGGLVAVADRWGLEILRDPSVVVTRPDALRAELNSNRRLARLRWSGGAAPWLVQIARTPSFEGAVTHAAGAPELSVPVDGESWFRVGSAASCGDVVWSDAFHIEGFSGARFLGGNLNIVTSESEFPIKISLPIVNPSSAPAPVTLESIPDGVAIEQPPTLAAGERAIIEVSISSSAPRVFSLRLSESGSEVAIRVSVLQPAAAPADGRADVILPGAAAAPGARDTRWETDVHLFCRTGVCDPLLTFVPAGTVASSLSISVPLTEGQSVAIDRAVRSLFGLSEATGHIRIRTGGELEAWATTWNDSPAGRFGQRIPGWSRGDEGAVRWLAGLRHDQLFRTNLGLVETAGQPRSVNLTLFDADGVEGASASISLEPHQASQQSLESLFGGQVTAGSAVRIESSPDVIAWASRVDQNTGDAAFSYAAAPAAFTGAAHTWSADVVGSAPGAEESNWKTELTLLNPSPLEATVNLLYLGSGSESASLTIPPGASFTAEDLFGALFPHLGPSTGPLRVVSTAPLIGSIRVYNDTSGGTWGQTVPLRELGLAAAAKPRQIFVVGGHAGQRINIGLVETSGIEAEVELRLLDQGGNLLSIETLRLAPLGFQTILGAIDALGLAGPVRLEIRAPSAVQAWASVVEDRTGDAIFIDGR